MEANALLPSLISGSAIKISQELLGRSVCFQHGSTAEDGVIHRSISSSTAPGGGEGEGHPQPARGPAPAARPFQLRRNARSEPAEPLQLFLLLKVAAHLVLECLRELGGARRSLLVPRRTPAVKRRPGTASSGRDRGGAPGSAPPSRRRQGPGKSPRRGTERGPPSQAPGRAPAQPAERSLPLRPTHRLRHLEGCWCFSCSQDKRSCSVCLASAERPVVRRTRRVRRKEPLPATAAAQPTSAARAARRLLSTQVEPPR